MKRNLLLTFFIFSAFLCQGQLLNWSPDFPTESPAGITITADGSKGNKGLIGYNPNDVYVHIGVITNLSTNSGDWKHVTSVWGTADAAFKATPAGSQDKWTFSIGQSLRSYFNITDPNEKIQKIAILFRSGDGNKKLSNEDGSDMFIPVYTTDIAVRITEPPFEPKFVPVPGQISKSVGDNIAISAKANKPSGLKLFLNGIEIQTATGAVTISGNPQIAVSGDQLVVAEAKDGDKISKDTLKFFVSNNVNVAPLPAGVQAGINYIDAGSATLVLYAPGKQRVAIIGDFPGNNWAEQSEFQMNKTPDNNYWWITLTGLESGKEYSFQYLVDGVLRIADPYAEKILDPFNDQYIAASTYPGLKPYPNGLTTEVVGILQTDRPRYHWSNSTFSRPDKRSLVIYELLVRDFVEKHDWATLKDTLNYLKNLGINAIEIMPFNEFEGNISWGYNPDFYFAPDKYYGPENTLKEFIDSCHANGIAVIMDIALNHSFGMSPLVRLFWDAANNRPSVDNPWFNPVAKHAFNVGYDMNHESAQTKYFVSRVVSYWLTEYKVDGFRFDLSKGFTQKQTCDDNGNNCNVAAWSAYDQDRIDIWQGYYDTLQKYNPGAYCILEHFADNSEETVLSSYGMMLWGNGNYNYNQATMGYSTDWNFDQVLANKRGWAAPHLVSYMESHDEERLMYKNLQFGNSNPSYNIKVPDTALQRQELAAAFFFTLPGPKMIWQFGELGYDYAINYCEDGTINDNCRTNPKPVRWDYLQDAKRKKLFDVYRKLIHLRYEPDFAALFTSNTIEQDFSGAFKWLRLSSSGGNIVVIGNFDIVSQTGTVTFPVAGVWYNYLDSTMVTATGQAQSFTLKPGEFNVFVYTPVSVPVKIKSFTGVCQDDKNVLNWKLENDQDVQSFEVQRSNDNTSFIKIGQLNPTGDNAYQYTDNDIDGSDTWYYRLKITDHNGGTIYSEVIALKKPDTSGDMSVIVAPNPFGGSLKIQIESSVARHGILAITTVNGNRVVKKTFDLQEGKNDIIIPETATLQNGIYFLKIIIGQKTTIKKVVKQN